MVVIEHKNKNKCKFFVVLGNRQAFLGMPETDMLNMIKVNIHQIGAKDARDGE